ncbi:MAG: DUF3078 domain-containing protein [Bacteroidales bacterium]|nr:DUF3078 domain-containing protein [Bacteroidales bacterium]
MKQLIFLFIFVTVYGNLYSEEKDTTKRWTKGAVSAFNLNQVSLSNWAAGGENSIAASVFLKTFANYSKDRASWDNNLDLGYGFMKSEQYDFMKNDDRIDFTSKYGHKTAKSTFISALINFKSQFDKGYNYPNDSIVTSNFMAPGYLIYSTGLDYKPNDDFSLFVSALTGKTTFVSDQKLADGGAYGVEKAEYKNGIKTVDGKKIRYEFGAFVSVKYKKNIIENINFSTKADFFTNYLKNPQNIDIFWDVIVSFKVNKYISTSIMTTLIYDDDTKIPIYKEENGKKTQVATAPRTQFKEVLAIGLTFVFPNKKSENK